jgi:hypothetical protein
MLPIRHDPKPALERVGSTPHCLFNGRLRFTKTD